MKAFSYWRARFNSSIQSWWGMWKKTCFRFVKPFTYVETRNRTWGGVWGGGKITFKDTCAHTWCYAAGRSLAHAHKCDATLKMCYETTWAFSLVYPLFLYCLPGLFLEPGLCLVFSNFAQSLLILKAAFEVQLSNRCPAVPQPRHLRDIKMTRQILPMHTASLVSMLKIYTCANLHCWFSGP